MDAEEKRASNNVVPFFGESATGCASGEVYGCASGEVFGCAFGEVTSCASFLAALLASLHLFVHCMAAFLLCSAVWYFFNLPHGPVGRPHSYLRRWRLLLNLLVLS